MSNEYLRLNDTQLNIKKSENLLAIIEEKRKDVTLNKELQSESSLFSELFKAFKDFFSNLGKPTIQKRLLKKESPARSSDYNDTMTEINNDIHVAYAETDSLSSVIVKDFNYSETDRQMLLNKVRKLSSDANDYSFYSDGAKTQSVYAVDDFIDNSKIDFSKITPGVPAAELAVNQGVITLKRTGNIDRSSLVSSITGIKESIPAWDSTNETGGYEGLYFGSKNEPRPEGGNWHVSYSSDGTRLFENGASESEKKPIRMKMFDNNADTFWEVEYITSPVVGYRDKYTGKQITVAEFNELINNELDSPGVTVSGDTIVTNEHGNLIENYVPVTGASTSSYLTCSFVVGLSNSETINWISLNPNNFGQQLYLEVLSIQTSGDGKTFSELEGFDDHEYSVTLTQQANEELTPQEVQDTLSPDKFKYAGQGVWVFAPRTANSIKFDLRQTRSYLKQYEVLMVEVEQTVTTTVTTDPSWWDSLWGADQETTTSSQTVKKEVEIPYLTGQITGFDVMSLEPGQVTTSNTDSSTSGAQATGAAIGALVIGPALALPTLGLSMVIGGVLGWLFGGLFGSSQRTDTSVGPQTISRQWNKTKNDRSRFAIGIRDINIYSYTFAETSEVVSKSFTSPGPISKIALEVEEQVPTVFYSDNSSTENDWIKYYISIDNGTSWKRISPMHHRTTISEDGKNPVPEIIYINSDVTSTERKNPLAYIDVAEAPYDVRFKAVLSRPTNIDNADSYTPVLYKYSLQIYPLGGL